METSSLGVWSWVMPSLILDTNFGVWPFNICRMSGPNSWKRLIPASVLRRQMCEIFLLVLEAVPTEHQEVISTYASPGAALRVSVSRQTVTLEANQLKDGRSGTTPRKQPAEGKK